MRAIKQAFSIRQNFVITSIMTIGLKTALNLTLNTNLKTLQTFFLNSLPISMTCKSNSKINSEKCQLEKTFGNSCEVCSVSVKVK